MHFIPAAFLTLVLFVPALSRADGAPEADANDPRAAHAATDENHDGEIDREEFHHRIVQVFYFADADRDGFASNGQLKVFDEAELFETADRNGDSKLSLYEFVNARFNDFDDADSDHNGTLSVQEVVAAFNE